MLTNEHKTWCNTFISLTSALHFVGAINRFSFWRTLLNFGTKNAYDRIHCINQSAQLPPEQLQNVL